MAHKVHRAPNGRSKDHPPDLEMAEGSVLEAGQLIETTVGTPQGSVASPLLANVYLQYVYDLWPERRRLRHAYGIGICQAPIGQRADLVRPAVAHQRRKWAWQSQIAAHPTSGSRSRSLSSVIG